MKINATAQEMAQTILYDEYDNICIYNCMEKPREDEVYTSYKYEKLLVGWMNLMIGKTFFLYNTFGISLVTRDYGGGWWLDLSQASV